jgi:hypothetical protein
VTLFCAALACGNAVVLSGYNGGHTLSYSDYGDLDGYVASNDYKVLPTVAVPVHSVSASPLHIDASLDHGYKHGDDQEHDYYVSIPPLPGAVFTLPLKHHATWTRSDFHVNFTRSSDAGGLCVKNRFAFLSPAFRGSFQLPRWLSEFGISFSETKKTNGISRGKLQSSCMNKGKQFFKPCLKWSTYVNLDFSLWKSEDTSSCLLTPALSGTFIVVAFSRC